MFISYCSETRFLVKLRKAINSQDVLKFQQAIAIRKISNTFINFSEPFFLLSFTISLAHACLHTQPHASEEGTQLLLT
jgi:hypothetical protein